MNVLIIPEDFRKDQYMLKPIMTAMFSGLGRDTAKIRVCQDPNLGGIGEALKWERIQEICRRYNPMIDVFLLIVDRDGEENRRDSLERLEGLAATNFPNKHFLAENAWQEVEVWVLAGHKLDKGWNWADIRNERNPKERYFEPFARGRNLLDGLGQGRKTLATEAAGHYGRIKQCCPEVAELEERVRICLGG